ncbi:Pkinase domain-containing protein/LRR_1 domain-containing protein/LRRNT_2 domain-containing protein/LRR_4 domain-containing protein [Cephalotus follicularis]|uniref:Pkinase domain-containing protein/LRR_1 domain-containing protein/LRRNT_2 domain-containing protein/LRR_4 domain-containing protein n=1 Tax=Cephalotus follicularis TaxID=3775 RepID=A0A1Q3C8W0_CEPFO|nr:Pkinase domain-containing protein/LRR_1 domain-containing protein/LRRNT_2 domain-containing protein/LRR_4 domain-containing protein [Cephalotus follicularis]
MKRQPNKCISLLSLMFVSLTSLLSSVVSDLATDRAALVTLRGAVGGRLLLWNLTATSPCQWAGVSCTDNRVVELRLPGMGLSGHLPVAIGNISLLQSLSLRFNALSGSLPPDFANLVNLRNLYLQGNLFSGEIPGFLFTMQNLIRLNLAMNNFTGTISESFNNLTRLHTLYLEENHLSGSIPDLNLPLEQFNASFNNLNGSIPNSLVGFPSSSFAGNSLCGKPLVGCNGNGTESGPKKKLSGGAIAGIVIGSVIGLLLLVLILIFLCRRKRSSSADKQKSIEVVSAKQAESEIPREKAVGDGESASASAVAKGDGKSLVFFGNTPRVFDLEDLLRASAEVLGKGTFGTAYKATLEMGISVAVKRLRDVAVSEKEFREKIEVVGAMNHENLVPLRACYYSRDEKLIVYDYMPMGSFSALLHGNRGAGRTPLNWDTRSGIALGAARGIAYIHSKGSAISHGNIKSSNILLTKSYEARVSDFGLAHLAGPISSPNRIDGYRAPEVTDARKVSQKADVYSFGVLLLELLTGKPPTHALLNEEGVDLPRWVQSVVKEEWTAEVFDIELLRYQNVEEEMVQLLQLAINCTTQYPDKRPSMAEVTSQIEEICSSPGSSNLDSVRTVEEGSS